jgi:calcineurin-like phosphoesterase family protein
MTVWFTSDTHYGHKNVIEYSHRPFNDVEEMNETLVTNWNAVVRPGDLVYHLGDFCLGSQELAIKTVKRLNGQKYLVFGNHDKRLRKDLEFLGHWIWARDLEQIEVEGQKLILCHYAMLTWNQSHRGSWQLHGHSHGSLADDPHSLRIDVGVDCHNMHPVSFETIRDIMSKKEFKPVDHHDARGE